MLDFTCFCEGIPEFGGCYGWLRFAPKNATRIQKRYTIKGMGSSVCLIRRVNLQDFYVPVGVILQYLMANLPQMWMSIGRPVSSGSV
jgi:hypothetical protein